MFKTSQLLIAILFFTSLALSAQENPPKDKKPFIVFKSDSIDDGRPLLSPFVTPGYTPELGALLALGVYFSFCTDKNSENFVRSSVPFVFSYSTKGAMVFDILPVIYFKGGKFIFEGNFWYKSMPDYYFGVGYKETIDKEQNAETSYYRDWWWVNPRLFYKVGGDWFFGMEFDLNSTQGYDASPEIMKDEVYVKYNERPFNSGVGVVVRYDTRDVPLNTYEGNYMEFSALSYGSYLGGDNNYQIYQLDLRKFVQVFKAGQVLALQSKTRLGFGEVPYGEMSQFGTPMDFRGYLWGRLRDKSMTFLLAEYRHKIYWNGKATKHSLVAWGGIGSIFNNQSKTYYGIPNGGVGYRYEIQKRVSVRVDFGFGRSSNAFYFNFQEAF